MLIIMESEVVKQVGHQLWVWATTKTLLPGTMVLILTVVLILSKIYPLLPVLQMESLLKVMTILKRLTLLLRQAFQTTSLLKQALSLLIQKKTCLSLAWLLLKNLFSVPFLRMWVPVMKAQILTYRLNYTMAEK